MHSLKEPRWWDSWNSAHRAEHSAYTDELFGRVLSEIEHLAIPSPQLLEIGCGTGLFAERVRKRCGGYLGLDISPTAVAFASNRVPDASFLTADLIAFEVQQAAFDVVIAIDSMAYMRQQEVAAARIFHALRPGGVAIFTSVNPFVFRRVGWVSPPGEGQYRNWLSARDFRNLLTRAGMRVRICDTFLPLGDRGLLRWTNSRKLNYLPNAVLGPRTVRRVKEWCGLGGHLIVVAERPALV